MGVTLTPGSDKARCASCCYHAVDHGGHGSQAVLRNLHQASQVPVLSITPGTRNPARGCFGLVLGIWPLRGVKSPALTGLGDAVNSAACGATSLLLGFVCRLDREAVCWGIGTHR